MDRYPIRTQIADLEAEVLALGEALTLLPVPDRVLAAGDLARVQAAFAALQLLTDQGLSEDGDVRPEPGGDGAEARAGEADDQVIWTAIRTTRLYAINTALSVALTPAQVAQVVVAEALPAVSADAGVIFYSPDGTNLRPVGDAGAMAWTKSGPLLPADPSPFADAARTAQAVWIESREELLARYPRWTDDPWHETAALTVVPLVIQGRTLGVMAFRSNAPRPFTLADRAFFLVLAQQCASALERVQLYEQARRAAVLEERNRLARDLHDSVSQAFYAIALNVTAGRANLEKDLSRVARALDNIQSLAAAGQADLRALLFDLHTDSVPRTGLVNALLDRARFLRVRHGQTVRTELCLEPDLPAPCKEAIYGIAREALHNATKHARANQIDIRLSQSSESLLLDIQDDGVGFNLDEARPDHYGLETMRERAAELGAELKIQTARGQGTRVIVVVPTSDQSASGGRTSRCAQSQ